LDDKKQLITETGVYCGSGTLGGGLNSSLRDLRPEQSDGNVMYYAYITWIAW